MTLTEFFSFHPKAAMGFSGGVDSAFLYAAARACGADVRPYLIKTPFQPAFELEDARRLAPDLTVLELDSYWELEDAVKLADELAQRFGRSRDRFLRILQADILADPVVVSNPADRCYHCKKALFGQLKDRALADGYSVLLDGTNASDDLTDRPGFRALEEYGVLSPLRLCGLTKDEIRKQSRDLGLFTWDKPAYACLATRIPTGTAIDRETLGRVEAAECALMALGYRDFRVRVFHGAARVQLKHDQFPQSQEAYAALTQALRPYFDAALLDLAGR